MCPGLEPQSSPGTPQGFIIKYKVEAVRSGKQNRGLSSVAKGGACWLRDPDLTVARPIEVEGQAAWAKSWVDLPSLSTFHIILSCPQPVGVSTVHFSVGNRKLRER